MAKASGGTSSSCAGSKHSSSEACDNGSRANMAIVITAVCLASCVYAFSLVFISSKPCWHLPCRVCDGDGLAPVQLQQPSVVAHPSAALEPAAWTPRNTSLAHIVFGIAASANLWKSRKHYVQEWWKPGQMRGYVWLEKPVVNETGWGVDVPLCQISANTSQFQYTHKVGSRSAIRLARIVTEMYRSVLMLSLLSQISAAVS